MSNKIDMGADMTVPEADADTGNAAPAMPEHRRKAQQMLKEQHQAAYNNQEGDAPQNPSFDLGDWSEEEAGQSEDAGGEDHAEEDAAEESAPVGEDEGDDDASTDPGDDLDPNAVDMARSLGFTREQFLAMGPRRMEIIRRIRGGDRDDLRDSSQWEGEGDGTVDAGNDADDPVAALGLDRDDLDEQTIAKIEDQHRRLQERDRVAREAEERAQREAQEREVDEFQGYLGSLNEREQSVFGKGSESEISEAQLRNRRMLYAGARLIQEDAEAAGRRKPSLRGALDQSYQDLVGIGSETTTRKLKEQVDSRRRQKTVRPTTRTTKRGGSASERDRSMARIAAKMREIDSGDYSSFSEEAYRGDSGFDIPGL